MRPQAIACSHPEENFNLEPQWKLPGAGERAQSPALFHALSHFLRLVTEPEILEAEIISNDITQCWEERTELDIAVVDVKILRPNEAIRTIFNHNSTS